jgi:hypothetical protein
LARGATGGDALVVIWPDRFACSVSNLAAMIEQPTVKETRFYSPRDPHQHHHAELAGEAIIKLNEATSL